MASQQSAEVVVDLGAFQDAVAQNPLGDTLDRVHSAFASLNATHTEVQVALLNMVAAGCQRLLSESVAADNEAAAGPKRRRKEPSHHLRGGYPDLNAFLNDKDRVKLLLSK